MMITTTAPQSPVLSAAPAFGAQPRFTQPRLARASWRALSAELALRADERSHYGTAVYGNSVYGTDVSNGGTTTTGNDRSFAICGMHVPAFAKKEHSQRKRLT